MEALLQAVSKSSVLSDSLATFAATQREIRIKQAVALRLKNYFETQLQDEGSTLLESILGAVRQEPGLDSIEVSQVLDYFGSRKKTEPLPIPPPVPPPNAGKEGVIYATFAQVMNDSPGLVIDKRAKRAFLYAPKAWELFQIGGSTKWTKSQRTLLFTLEYKADDSNPHVLVKLFIGPAERSVREKFFAFAFSHQPPLALARQALNQDWDRIYQRVLCTAVEVADQEPEQLAGTLRKRWYEFARGDLETLTELFANQFSG